ncbi:MAG: hypothetical protein U0736_25475 [Gemmataceae bacterium]
MAAWPAPQTPNPANAEDLGKGLRERLKEAGIAPAPVLACLGRNRFIVKEIRFPAVPEPEEPAIVRFQTIKELTEAPEDVVIDYLVIGNGSATERKAAALVIRKEVLLAYRTLCEAAGLKLAALTPRVIGIATRVKAARATTDVPADAAVAVVVLGSVSAELCILQGDRFLLNRALSAGANLSAEVRRTLAVHAGQSGQPVAAVFLAGDDAVRRQLADSLEVPVHPFDPLADAPADSVPADGRGLFAGPVGVLALRATGDLPVNFVAPREPKPPSNPNLRLIRMAAVAVATLFLGVIVLGQVLNASWSTQLAELEEQKTEVEAKLLTTRENAKRLKAIDDWDNLVWLDELYDLTARIPDVNQLRLTSISTEPLARNPKSRAVARVTIKGTLLGRSSPRKPLDELVSQFNKDGFYSAEPPKVENDQFTLVVFAERRGPADYTHKLKDVKTAPAPTSRPGRPPRGQEEDDEP